MYSYNIMLTPSILYVYGTSISKNMSIGSRDWSLHWRVWKFFTNLFIGVECDLGVGVGEVAASRHDDRPSRIIQGTF